jgi:hypothetical protein
MKKTLLITLLLIPFLGISQTKKPIDGFLGIKFGSTKAAVIAAMKAKGAVLDKENSKANNLDFNNVKLGRRTTVDFDVAFVDNKAYSAAFMFRAADDPHTVQYYNDLVNDINEIYGKGTSTLDFKAPYKAGDSDEELAIESGNADIFTDWQSGDFSMQASITNKFQIILLYQDDKLDAQAKAKEKSDL